MVKKTKEEEKTITYIAVGAGIVGMLLLGIVMAVGIVVMVIVRKRQSRQGMYVYRV